MPAISYPQNLKKSEWEKLKDPDLKNVAEKTGLLKELERFEDEFLKMQQKDVPSDDVYHQMLDALYFLHNRSDDTAHSLLNRSRNIKKCLADVASVCKNLHLNANFVKSAIDDAVSFHNNLKKHLKHDKERAAGFLIHIYKNYISNITASVTSCTAFLDALERVHSTPTRANLQNALSSGKEYLSFVKTIRGYMLNQASAEQKFISQGLSEALKDISFAKLTHIFHEFKPEQEHIWLERIEKLNSRHDKVGMQVPEESAIGLLTSDAHNNRILITIFHNSINHFLQTMNHFFRPYSP